MRKILVLIFVLGFINHLLAYTIEREDFGKIIEKEFANRKYNVLFDFELKRGEEIMIEVASYSDTPNGGFHLYLTDRHRNNLKKIKEFIKHGQKGRLKYKTLMGGKHHIEISSSSFNVGYFELKIESIGVNKKGKTQLKANTDTKTGNKLSNEKTLKELLKEEYFKGYQKGIKDCKNGAIDCKK